MSENAGGLNQPVESARHGRARLPWLYICLSGGTGLLFLALATAFSGSSPQGYIIALGALLSGLAVCLFHRYVLHAFIIVCAVFPNELELTFIDVGFMKIYLQDAVFLYLLLYVGMLIALGKASLPYLPFNRYVYLYLLVGVIAAAVGLLVTGNAYSNVLGDFRRSFFYFFAYFFVLVLTATARDLRMLLAALLTGSILVSARGLLQALSGEFVIRRFGDAAHILNHFEATFATFAVFVAIASMAASKPKRIMWILVASFGFLFIVLANFRTVWVGLMAGLITFWLLMPKVTRSRYIVITALAATIGVALLAAIWTLQVSATRSSVGENVGEKLSFTAIRYDQNISWRWASYRNALNLWSEQPLLGRGLGEELEFVTITSSGKPMITYGHRVHNSYIWLLLSLGVFGMAYFIYMHGRFAWTSIKQIQGFSPDSPYHVYLMASIAFYVTIMVSACFDVYLESAPPVTLLSVVMAAVLLIIHKRDALEELPAREVG